MRKCQRKIQKRKINRMQLRKKKSINNNEDMNTVTLLRFQFWFSIYLVFSYGQSDNTAGKNALNQ